LHLFKSLFAAPNAFRKVGLFLLAATACLGSGSALAQLTFCAAGSVYYYVAIQPIGVLEHRHGLRSVQ
jgi:hypothetical protein